MSTPTLWLTIAGAAAVTFALRISFIVLLGRLEIPPSSRGRSGSFRRRC